MKILGTKCRVFQTGVVEGVLGRRGVDLRASYVRTRMDLRIIVLRK